MDISIFKNMIQYSDPFCPELLIEQSGDYQSFYSGFDHINTRAKLVIVGMSPGHTQAQKANIVAGNVLRAGGTAQQALEQAKKVASFSGPLRNNLVRLLNHIGIHDLLKINCASTLFTAENEHLVHYTSAFRYPVLKKGKPISTAKPFKNEPMLLNMVESLLAEEAQALPHAIWLPLGQGVESALLHLAQQGLLTPEQILSGLPHPSGANAERISYFLGEKLKSQLSIKTNPHKLDAIRDELVKKLTHLKTKAR
ncbi:hypothetical protein C942_02336 [Photobacterium marinum]|uniref:Uracil-DNA glycosylase-like domain-containing protein n=1 Tax=Photobacterium marinum TaxID=1056511 RepID=L8J8J6_9GAMM|nr:hypothetical protein [Photobacterium marinum]ELR64523.1 hypothetical protein C942_02336 [Photobacterium marinum]